MELNDHEVVILISGKDSSAEECSEIEAYINKSYPRTEVYVLEGGQEVYSYIIVAE